MALDSHRMRPLSSIVGTRPFGFIFLYQGSFTTPNCRPASRRSYASPSSSAHQSTFFTLTELVRPQIFSIVLIPSSHYYIVQRYSVQDYRKFSVLRGDN